MGSKSKPNFPSANDIPNQRFATTAKDITGLSDTGHSLIAGDFMNPGHVLNENVTLNSQIAKDTFDLASRDVIETRDRAQQDILNQLEANGQLTSSVTGDSLSQLNKAFSSDIADISTNIRINDQDRALKNRFDLFGLGLNTLNTSASLGQQQQQIDNAFAFNQFDREFATEAERVSRANSGGSFGSVLTGALGGAVAGIPLAGATGGLSILGGAAAGGVAGGFGGQSTGNAIASGGFGTLGGGTNFAGRQTQSLVPAPVQSADDASSGLNDKLLDFISLNKRKK